ncbi:MAG: sulfur oxidation c-type cytochrome SoxX [Limnobacter sp.]|uniref:sulfur oxidation c-type cytochrome SoxX n=1 Tax=Limnobacter sp. TaxID=2003368 RepID=UPI003919C32E
MKLIKIAALGLSVAVVSACAVMSTSEPTVSADDVQAVLASSFKEKGQAKLDRIQQTALQKSCSDAEANRSPVSGSARDQLEKAALNAIKYPSDGVWLGDWKKGESVAQTGTGLQFSDDPKNPAGGNCYACHQLDPKELSYGNIGPSLYQYGKMRGQSEDILRYTWGKIWNSHAYNACSNMPRFGAEGILSEAQIRDVMALLLSPESPVNK